MDIFGLEYFDLGYYISTDTEVYILMHGSEAYDMGRDNISSCIPTKSAVCAEITAKVEASIRTPMYPFEAYNVSRDEVSSCIPTKSAVCDETTAKVKA